MQIKQRGRGQVAENRTRIERDLVVNTAPPAVVNTAPPVEGFDVEGFGCRSTITTANTKHGKYGFNRGYYYSANWLESKKQGCFTAGL